ncbi:hypothetical protein MSPP1_000124 [Malassezia sp. CBS 17886]|nr:hypothetical protein MSPP1_000124 [Malassezia sp. CBS 17886]
MCVPPPPAVHTASSGRAAPPWAEHVTGPERAVGGTDYRAAEGAAAAHVLSPEEAVARETVRDATPYNVWACSPERPLSDADDDGGRARVAESACDAASRAPRHARRHAHAERRRKRHRSHGSSSVNTSVHSPSRSPSERAHTADLPCAAENLSHMDGAPAQRPWGNAEKRADGEQADGEQEDDDVGPQLPHTFEGRPVDPRECVCDAHTVLTHRYGGQLLPGEGMAMASYVQDGQRVPRRGEIGLDSGQISAYERAGYVMSGSRHGVMNAVRIRKESQVISAEERRTQLNAQREERAKKETEVIGRFREMVDRLQHGGTR